MSCHIKVLDKAPCFTPDPCGLCCIACFPIDTHSSLQEVPGWPKSCDLNVQVYCGLIINEIDLILSEMSSFCQPFEDFTKISQNIFHFLIIFVFFGNF